MYAYLDLGVRVYVCVGWVDMRKNNGGFAIYPGSTADGALCGFGESSIGFLVSS